MEGAWPWPEDSTPDRLRRIIDRYRMNLMRVSPGICSDVDEVMLEWGQGWVCNDEIVDVNAWLSAKDISAKHPVTVWDVFNWERKGLYKGRKQGSRKLFRVGDVLAAMARR